MIGYDFDKTIYKGDCSTNFFFYINLKKPYLLLFFPFYIVVFALYGLKIISKKRFKQLMFFYIKSFKNIDELVEKFWEKNIKKIEGWYLNQQREDDIIISAGLDFIVKPATEILGIKNVLATEFDLKNAKILGENCYGEEKVKRFYKEFGEIELDAFYSDSLSDLPMMKISKSAFLVKKSTPKEIKIEK